MFSTLINPPRSFLRHTGTAQRAAGASTPKAPKGTTKASSQSSKAETKSTPHNRYQHGLKHHPRPQPGSSRPAEPNPKPSKLPSSTPSTTAIDEKSHKQMLSSLREWLPPENPPDSVETGGDAEGEEADGVEEDVLGDALDDELVAKVYGGVAPQHSGLGLSITGFIGGLFTSQRSESQSFMNAVSNVMHLPHRAEVRAPLHVPAEQCPSGSSRCQTRCTRRRNVGRARGFDSGAGGVELGTNKHLTGVMGTDSAARGTCSHSTAQTDRR